MFYFVALRKESVDRNRVQHTGQTDAAGSLSARRAWIEIDCLYPWRKTHASLSARRAWIEISTVMPLNGERIGRSPQGERG